MTAWSIRATPAACSACAWTSAARLMPAPPGKTRSALRGCDGHSSRSSCRVMPGPDPGIHVVGRGAVQDVDGRDEPGHDKGQVWPLGAEEEMRWNSPRNMKSCAAT